MSDEKGKTPLMLMAGETLNPFQGLESYNAVGWGDT